ncbi:alkylation response protein AidB-like acyl-CoA dehydrogenase [Amycolatopsis lexingtonensis]|uniref:Alkylation response protein AidB-like acyl-CoA dehydrogenase n=1 Tax=Amycolatopsis lexingtonensis TaxID=218822 RepID=A0ABR9HWY3_9PSEU|nr:acyl-CoA dehydrogenase family protein [Amycolatopsis lexingtonensis]MBE1495444.1 alkylation response protein AidB-like acyl-CoA dehydrogenase [Amycolatopsis lexingtonensis]
MTTAPLAELVGRVTKVAEEHVRRTDDEATFPVEALEELRATGLLGLQVPAEDGGLGGSLADVLETSTELGRVDMSLAMIFAMHCQQVAAVLAHADGKLRAELVPEIAAGRLYLGSVTTEAGKGGHLLTAESAAAWRDGELLVDRFAPIVTGGRQADGFLITMRSPDSEADNQVSLVYASRAQVEIEPAGGWNPLGMRASDSGAMKLRGRLPAHQVIGRHGDFHTIVTTVFGPMAHLGWASCWLGTAAGALSRVIASLRGSRGKTDLSSELLMTRLSRARQRLDTVHALISHAREVVETTADLSVPKVQLLINAVKITAAEECYRAIDELVDAVGMRHGYLRDSPTRLEQSLRDLRSAVLNYSNDRLHLADGRLTLLDQEVRFA